MFFYTEMSSCFLSVSDILLNASRLQTMYQTSNDGYKLLRSKIRKQNLMLFEREILLWFHRHRRHSLHASLPHTRSLVWGRAVDTAGCGWAGAAQMTLECCTRPTAFHTCHSAAADTRTHEWKDLYKVAENNLATAHCWSKRSQIFHKVVQQDTQSAAACLDRPTSFTNLSHHRLPHLRTDSTDFMTGAFLLSILVFCF